LKDTIVLAYPISSNEIRCLVDVPGSKQPPISNGEMASYLKTVVAPQVCIVAWHNVTELKLILINL